MVSPVKNQAREREEYRYDLAPVFAPRNPTRSVAELIKTRLPNFHSVEAHVRDDSTDSGLRLHCHGIISKGIVAAN
jgi:hypothetical protein